MCKFVDIATTINTPDDLMIRGDVDKSLNCKVCGSKDWWRLKSSPHWKKDKPKKNYQKWICEKCHTSPHPENNIERLK